MRACFLGQNVCALGYGVATLQTPKFDDQASEKASPTMAPRPYPVVMPVDGDEHGRPGFYPVLRPLPQNSRPL